MKGQSSQSTLDACSAISQILGLEILMEVAKEKATSGRVLLGSLSVPLLGVTEEDAVIPSNALLSM